MKKMISLKKTCLCAVLVIMSQMITLQQSLSQVIPPEYRGYRLVWEDNFDGMVLNRNNWNIEVDGRGGGNYELQFYREQNISVGIEPTTGANCLIITARLENFGGRLATSGRLNTLGKMAVRYGKVQARIWLPRTGNGLWPAFWMMGHDFPQVGWPRCGEIDILEMGHVNGINRGTQDRYFSSHFHWGEAWTPQGWPNWGQSYTHPTGIQDGFYLFTLIWDPQFVTTYFGTDANPFLRRIVRMGISGPPDPGAVGRYFHKPFFIILNVAVGGTFTGITGNQNISRVTALADGPRRMYVDYVRVFQRGDPGEEFTGQRVTNIPPMPEFKVYTLYPNPVTNEIRIDGNTTPKTIRIFDIRGSEIVSERNTRKIAASTLTPGYYVIVIEDINGKTERHKFIKI